MYSKTGYLLGRPLAVRLAGRQGYDRAGRNAPRHGQASTDHRYTIHAHSAFHDFLVESGYAAAAAHAFLDLLCSRIESWFFTASASRDFEAYKVWVVDLVAGPAPGVAPSPGLIAHFHLVLTPFHHELGGTNQLAQLPPDGLYGVPHIRQPENGAAPHSRPYIAATSVRCPVSHEVTKDNPVLHLLDSPPPKKSAYYQYSDLFTLLSAPTPAAESPSAAPLVPSTWRFSWSASPRALHDAPTLEALPAATFLLPSNARDVRLDAARLATNSAAHPVEGVALVCKPLPATYVVGRSEAQGGAPLELSRARGHGGASREREKRARDCVVM